MQHSKLQFIRKFHLAFALLMLATLAIVWIYHDSVNWHKHDLKRINSAHKVMQGYQELSNLVFRDLSAMTISVLLWESGDPADAGARALVLREAVSTVRQDIAKEAVFNGSEYSSENLEQLVEIESVVEEFIHSSEMIELAMYEGRAVDARHELVRLRNSGFTNNFNILIAAGKADQESKLLNVDREDIALTRSVVDILPILMTALMITSLSIIFVLLRHHARSVGALYQGALTFRKGDLSHRVPDLSEAEFKQVGKALNLMALRLSEHQKQLQDTNLQLEKAVDERARELQEINRKLAAVDVYRRKWLADISHEFRTPLTVIRGEAEIALRGADRKDSNQVEPFKRIINQADSATRLVDDLLFIARADAGEPRLKLSSVSVRDLIESVCQEFGAMAEKKGIKIELGRAVASATVYGDEGRLRQVFSILLQNAIRYSNAGDRVEIWVRPVKSNVEIEFRDEGIGLTEQESELAFDRFYRAPNAQGQATGTGLGLPVAKAIVEAHKGVISLTGKTGHGAIATVVLPIGREFGIIT